MHIWGMTESCDSFGWFFATAPGRNDHFGQFQAELCHFSRQTRHSSAKSPREHTAGYSNSNITCRHVGYYGNIPYIWEAYGTKGREDNTKLTVMDTDRKWVVVRIDGKIAAISTDYAALAAISARLAQQKSPAYSKVTAETAGFEDVWDIRNKAGWDDMALFGTEFQKKVWRRLFDLTHEEDGRPKTPRLISYSDFADLCQNKAGVRAVAHAIGLNPVAVAIPCHLVIPKESIDYIKDIQEKAQSTIFKGDDISMEKLLQDKGIDFGEYALGRRLKRVLIQKELSQ